MKEIWFFYLFDPVNGIDTDTSGFRNQGFCDAFLKSNFKVTLFSGNFCHYNKRFRSPVNKFIQTQDGLRVVFLKGCGYINNVSLRRILHHVLCSVDFIKFIILNKIQRPDHIHICLPCLELGFIAACYAKIFKIPFTLDVHDNCPENHIAPLPKIIKPIGKIFNIPYVIVAKFIARNAAFMISVSKDFLDTFIKYADRDLNKFDKVVYLGYKDLKSLEPIETKPKISINLNLIFCGTVGKVYDVETAIKAVIQISQHTNLNIQFYIAGSGDNLEFLISKYKSEASIKFLGRLARPELAKYLQISHIGIACYSSDATQTVPYKPFEYMANSLYILHSLDTEFKDICKSKNCGEYYKAGDVEQLTNLLLKSIQAPKELARTGRQNRKTFDMFFKQEDLSKIFVNGVVQYHSEDKN